MIFLRRLSTRSRRVVAPRAGLIAFGTLVLLGSLAGALLGGAITRGIRSRAEALASQRAERIGGDLDLALAERERALRLLALMPSVARRNGSEREAFASFRTVYPEFERLGQAGGLSEPPSLVSKDPRTLLLRVQDPRGSVFGLLRSGWPAVIVPGVQGFGADPHGLTSVLVGAAGSATATEAEPPNLAIFRGRRKGRVGIERWGDGETYLTAVRSLVRPSGAGARFAVVTGIPTAFLAERTARAKWNGLFAGTLLGIVAGAAAWVVVARSTAWFRRQNDVLEKRVQERTVDLEAAERSFRGIFEHVPLGLYQCDPTGAFLRVNPTLASTLGYPTPEAMVEALGSLRSIGSEEDRLAFLRRLAVEGEVREAQTLAFRADGRKVVLSERARAVRNEAGEVLLIEGAMHDVTSQRDLEARLRELGETDPLTGLLNRRGLDAAIEAAVFPVAFLTLDIDRFKEYNDAHGHPEGDRALQIVAGLLRKGSRAGDRVARTGGEEFVVVLPATGAEEAYGVAERMRQVIAGCADAASRLTVSGGVAVATGSWELVAALASADRALYRAKGEGRDRIVVERKVPALETQRPPDGSPDLP